MPSYLPPPRPSTSTYAQPGYNPATELNTGNLGFMTLPVERTVGGFRNNIWNPNATPFPGGFTENNAAMDVTSDFNPFLQGYMSGGEWKPYLPDKIVLGQRASNSGPVGQATQQINGQGVNIGANNLPAGHGVPKPYQFGTSLGDVREEIAAPSNGVHFGEVGKPGYKFMPGSFENGRFYSTQPATLNPKPDPMLGVFRNWNPAAAALESYRRQP